jgi:hypothetical protein
VSEPLSKPDHLKPVEDDSPAAWIAKRKAAVAAGVIGVVSFLVVAVATTDWDTPDFRISVPGFLLAAIASGVSLARREPQGAWVWALGLAIAAAAIVLPWFFMIAAVVAGAALLMMILHAIL